MKRLPVSALAGLLVASWLTGTTATYGQFPADATGTAADAGAVAGNGSMEGRILVDDLVGPIGLAVSPTGQTLSVLRGGSGDVLGVDLGEPTKRWTAVPATAGIEPRAVGSIDSSTLALLAREGEDWSIRVHRLPAPGTQGAADPVQTVKLGSGTGTPDDHPSILVSPTRDWLAVTGLPDTMPKIVRLTITGARLGSPSERRCPPLAARPSAVTVGSAGEWGLFLPAPADSVDSGTFLSWVSPSGAQRWLHLDTGLRRVSAATCCRETGLLWALASGSSDGGAEGLWRVDAAYVAGRQVARAVSIATLASPTGLVCLPNGDVAVAHGAAASRIVRFSPRAGAPKEPVR